VNDPVGSDETFELKEGALTATVSAKGAELVSLRKDGVPYLYEGDAPKFWNRSAPLLFPVVGRCVDDSWCVEGKTYPMPRHGFARDMTFEPVRGSDASVELSLEDSKATRARYPFAFELTASYALNLGALEATYRLENREERSIPFSFGLHPAFRWPLDPAAPKESYGVDFGRKMRLERVRLVDGLRGKKRDPLLKNAERLKLSDALFDDDALVLRRPDVTELVLSSDRSPRGVRLRFSECTWLGIWSKPGPPFVCLEPWRGVAGMIGDSGDVETKEGIEWLEPGATFEYSATIEPLG
jgi:galactose mutarotase-like enzyme